jgi:F0F1-type ATP synthase assembly protein I
MTATPGGIPGGAGGPRRPEDGSTTAAQFAGLGLQLAVCIVGGLYLGQWLDRRLGTDPWLMITGVFVGFGASFYSMYRKLTAAQAREDAARRERQGGGPSR